MEQKTVQLTPEEWEYMKSRLTPGRPLCWFCLHRPQKPETMEHCGHKPLSRLWKDAARKRRCDGFQPDGDRIALRKEEKPENREQFSLPLWP